MEGPDAWHAAQWQDDKSYIHDLTEQDISELDAAVKSAIDSGVEEIQVSAAAAVRLQPR